MRTVVIVNQKGGCGKTTTAINLAGIFASRGLRTLLVDLDPQSHCAAGLAIPEQRIDQDIADALVSDAPIERDRLVWSAGRSLDLIPSRTRLAGLEAA
ncbi:MAG: AAA family ATPase, partial [Planctomycetota bacterium]